MYCYHEKMEKGINVALSVKEDLGLFKVWLLVSQLLGVVSVILVSTWCGQYLGGFAWQSNPKIEFNIHPFFMVFGTIFLYGEALVAYRVLRYQKKKFLKLLHFVLHTVAFILTVVALKAAFDSKNLSAVPMTNLYTLHSWVGIAAVFLFAMQYLCGFLAFLFPFIKKTYSAKYLSLHVFFGLAIFSMSVAAALNGITEKLMYTEGSFYKNLRASAVLGHLLGFCLVLFALVIVYIVANPQFKRRPLPEEVQLHYNEQSYSTI